MHDNDKMSFTRLQDEHAQAWVETMVPFAEHDRAVIEARRAHTLDADLTLANPLGRLRAPTVAWESEMATVLRAGPNHVIVHIGIEPESEFKVEIHVSLKVAEELVVENETPFVDDNDDSFEIYLGKAVLAKLTQPR